MPTFWCHCMQSNQRCPCAIKSEGNFFRFLSRFSSIVSIVAPIKGEEHEPKVRNWNKNQIKYSWEKWNVITKNEDYIFLLANA